MTLGLLTKCASFSWITVDSSDVVSPAARTSPISGTVIIPSMRTTISWLRSASFQTNRRSRSPAPIAYGAPSATGVAGAAACCAAEPSPAAATRAAHASAPRANARTRPKGLRPDRSDDHRISTHPGLAGPSAGNPGGRILAVRRVSRLLAGREFSGAGARCQEPTAAEECPRSPARAQYAKYVALATRLPSPRSTQRPFAVDWSERPPASSGEAHIGLRSMSVPRGSARPHGGRPRFRSARRARCDRRGRHAWPVSRWSASSRPSTTPPGTCRSASRACWRRTTPASSTCSWTTGAATGPARSRGATPRGTRGCGSCARPSSCSRCRTTTSPCRRSRTRAAT